MTAPYEITHADGQPVDAAHPIDVLDGTAVAALASILAKLAQVGLDSTSLAALENITATVSGPVALDSTTLAALETINAVVTGTVALDGPTLAALEQITAVVSGTVAVSSLPEVEVKNDAGTPLNTLDVSGLVPKVYDWIGLGYSGSDVTTVTYKVGGAAGATVAVLTLGYTSGVLTSVGRT